MPYKRLEPAPVAGSAVGPALGWLANVAQGERALLQAAGGTHLVPTNIP